MTRQYHINWCGSPIKQLILIEGVFAYRNTFYFFAEQLFDFIRGYNVTETREGGFVNNATDTPTYRAVKEKLGLAKLGNVYLSKKDLDNLFKTEI